MPARKLGLLLVVVALVAVTLGSSFSPQYVSGTRKTMENRPGIVTGDLLVSYTIGTRDFEFVEPALILAVKGSVAHVVHAPGLRDVSAQRFDDVLKYTAMLPLAEPPAPGSDLDKLKTRAFVYQTCGLVYADLAPAMKQGATLREEYIDFRDATRWRVE